MNAWDVIVIGGGPAGHKAAVHAAGAGRRVVLVEQERAVGGECVRRGTIPSKTLKETATALLGFQRRSGGVVEVKLAPQTQLESLMARKDQVIAAHEAFMADELAQAGVERVHGRAKFVGVRQVEVQAIDGARGVHTAPVVIVATGSRPRTPAEIPVDHEHVLDSDSILSMTWLPKALTVLGAGVIASEYASIFAALGVEVTMIDRGPRPVAFLDDELTQRFVTAFEGMGGRFLGDVQTRSVRFDGVSKVVTTLSNGTVVESEKLLCALGRVANVGSLALEATGLSVNARGLVEVDANCLTKVPGVYAVGDIIGPPSLASSSMEQGRRAVRHAFGEPVGPAPELIPAGVYTIPEMSGVGLTEAQARAKGPTLVGRASFDRLARGQISAATDGLLKLVCDGSGRKLLGVHVISEGAAELVHLGQLALVAGLEVDTFVDGIFNFPTLAEAYRVAALDVVRQRTRASAH
jgi:NAD(P) transhydrogenase